MGLVHVSFGFPWNQALNITKKHGNVTLTNYICVILSLINDILQGYSPDTLQIIGSLFILLSLVKILNKKNNWINLDWNLLMKNDKKNFLKLKNILYLIVLFFIYFNKF